MSHGRLTDRTALAGPFFRMVAIATIGFYVCTAHLTKGHEADFGKQWLAARLVATGNGGRLFHLPSQRQELERHFAPETIVRGIWRDGIGGPTYPPTFAIVAAPLGWLSPRVAQWTVIQLSLLAMVLTAGLISGMTRGKVPWEHAIVGTICLPSFFFAIGLGQNTAWSLLILVGGLRLLASGRDVYAGLVWGIFAAKPTWGVAVVWLPLALGRPRVFWGMALSAAALFLATLPICGIQSWIDWLSVAQRTEQFYQSIPRWTGLSRDLPGLLRRASPGPLTELLGWCLVLAVVILSIRAWREGGGRSSLVPLQGPSAVALLAGVVLSCPRFMFYDVTLAAPAFLVAFSEWSRMERTAKWSLAGLFSLFALGSGYAYWNWSMLGPPVETVAVLGLWLWALARVGTAATDRAEAHERTIGTAAIPNRG